MLLLLFTLDDSGERKVLQITRRILDTSEEDHEVRQAYKRRNDCYMLKKYERHKGAWYEI
jgi:hypothetical protein